MVSSEDFIRLTIEHIETMEIKYSFLDHVKFYKKVFDACDDGNL